MVRKLLIVLSLGILACSCAEKKDPASWVDVFIGTDKNIHCFPDATVPFGMLQPGPQGGNFDWDHCAGWHWTDTTLTGFSQTRLSGTGATDLGDVFFMPFSRHSNPLFVSRFKHSASPGYYQAELLDNGVTVEVTVSPRVALYRCTFEDPESRKLYLNIASAVSKRKPAGPITRNCSVTCPDPYTVTGFNHVDGWTSRDIYSVLAFDTPVVSVEEVSLDSVYTTPQHILDFGAGKKTIEIKVALSSVDAEGALGNLATLPGWDFDKVRKEARASWNQVLGTIEAEGSREERTVLYTALYHACIQPMLFSDADGRFRGPDNEVHAAPRGYYSTMSIWDTFRSANLIYSMLLPQYAAPMVESMLQHCEIAGILPIWPLWGKESWCMIADHAVPLVMDAYKKGLPGITLERAYEAVRKTLTTPHPEREWDEFDACGYFPIDGAWDESVSRTLESSYDAWCAAEMAKELGRKEDYAYFHKRAEAWKRLFDPATHLARGRDSKGNWRTPFDPTFLSNSTIAGDYTEGNGWQYTWHVLQDPEGLMAVMGGKDAFVAKLDSLFNVDPEDAEHWKRMDLTGRLGLYVHGNELSHHIPYLFTLADRPDRTAEVVRTICRELYSPSPDGLCGQDDCGQTSAWYLFSALGFYPLNPASQEFVLGAPQIPHAVLHLPGGDLEVVAENLSEENLYVGSATLNGKPVIKKFSWSDIKDGGRLVFTMTSAPVQYVNSQEKDPASWVDVFIGTDSNIHCHPDATYPFGRLQPGPQGGNFDWDHSAGWHWKDTTLIGFSQNRMSGGVGGYGAVLLMPFSRHNDPLFVSHFTHEACPGYYKADLPDNGVSVEVTTSPYVAMYRVKYDDRKSRKVYFNFQSYCTRRWPRKIPVDRSMEVRFPDSKTLTGRVEDEFFAVSFDTPVVGVEEVRLDSMYTGPQYIVDFGPGSRTVEFKVALSLVDGEGPLCNLATLPTWDFDRVKDEARAAWNGILGTIEAEGRAEDLVKIYTAYYHSCIHPNLVSDADGRYRGPDGKQHEAPEGYYSTMGFWDIFRSVTPLYSLLIPKQTAPIIETIFRHYDVYGTLPVWPSDGWEGLGMMGDHAVPVVMDAYKKGYPGVTLERTYAAVKKTLTTPRFNREYDVLDKVGYFPNDMEEDESVAKTLEISYDDWCAAQLAKEIGNEADYKFFSKRSESWKYLFDRSTLFMRGRDSKGKWTEPLDPQYLCNSTNPGDYTEANAWQYTWHVIQDPEGLIEAFGGRDKFVSKLDDFFTLQPDDPAHWVEMDHKVWVGLHVPGNELSVYIPFMYTFADRLDRTAWAVRRVCREAFKATPDGIPGQDDQGGTSSSYLFMALGFFPVNPASQEYILGAPQVPHAVLHLPGGDLRIDAENFSEENYYVESVTLDGRPIDQKFTWYDIKNGGHLVYKMTSQPSRQ